MMIADPAPEPSERGKMRKTFHDPDTVHPPAGDYSRAARLEVGSGSLIFVSGQLPVDAGGNMVGEDDMGLQAEQTFENVRAVLEANGASMADAFFRRSRLPAERPQTGASPPSVNRLFETWRHDRGGVVAACLASRSKR